MGCEEGGRGHKKEIGESGGTTLQTVSETVKLETGRGNWNFECRGEMRRY